MISFFAKFMPAHARKRWVASRGTKPRNKFLRMQFDAQHQHYQTHFPEAEFCIIMVDGRAVGRLYLLRAADEFRIIDITLLPEHRNKGIGSKLLKSILTESVAASKPVRLHVERFNRALQLYRRLGFSVVDEGDIYFLMERKISK